MTACAVCSAEPATTSPPTPSGSISFDIPTGRLALAPLIIDLPPKRGLGVYYRNVDCWVRIKSIMPADMPPDSGITNEVGQALFAAKLKVTIASGASVADAGQADYLLVGTIPDVHADACVNDFFNSGAADVDAQVAIAWKLWSVKDNRVVYETTTTGTAHAKDPGQTINAGVYAAADDATRLLLGTSAFQQYMTYGHVVVPVAAPGMAPAVPTGGSAPIPQPPAELNLAPAPAVALQPILVPVTAANPAGTTPSMAQLRAATARIGSGAGLVLGEGYILTASELATGAGGIAVIMPDGQSTTAQMVRRDESAGVALLRVGDQASGGSPIQPRRNQVGDPVFGPGPSQLTRGSFTATRASGGQDTVALDGVAVGSPLVDANGNVIGLLLPEKRFLSIGVAFRNLQLGAELGGD